jgi:hypothetical protein
MSPEDFQLRLLSIDRWGHMAIEGLIASQLHRGVPGRHRHAVEFGFEFDPTLLPKVLTDIQAIATGRG